MGGQDERELAELLRQRPEQGLAAALDEYGALVKSICRRALGGAAAAEDVEECVAEAFWRLYQRRGAIRSEYGLKSWLCGIARHVALDKRRELARRTAGGDMPAGVDAVDLPDMSDLSDPAEFAARAELRRTVQECVDGLGQPDRKIFIMRYYFGDKVADIAHTLGLDAKAVENRLYRGRLRLKTALLERGISR